LDKLEIDPHHLYEQAFRLASNGIAFISLKRDWIKANPIYKHFFGYSEQELFALSAEDLAQPEDFVPYTQNLPRLLDGEASSFTMDMRCIHKEGRFIWAELTVSLVRDESGIPLYYIHNLIDITEKKRAQERYHEIENLYNLISENVQDVISYNSNDGICLYCSPSMESVLGYKPEEIIGFATVHLYHPEDMASLMKQTFSDNDIVAYRVLHKKGYYVWVESTFRRLYDPEGTVGITRDITQRKKNEDNLAEAQRIALIGSWENDLATGVITCSAQFFRIYDMNPEDFKGTSQELLELVHPEDQMIFLNSLELCIAGKDLNNEFRHIKPDGTIKYLHTRGTMSEDKQRMHGTIQDVTEQKLLIRAVNEAESTNKAKSEFLAMMSHEIRTPLNGVIGMADLLLETNLNEAQKEYADIIGKSGNTLLSIINDILDFSKIESGKMELENQLFQVKSCIQEAFEVLSSQANAKHIDMVYRLDDNIPQQVYGDYGKLQQVLLNLTGNALKFTAAGQIIIEAKLHSQQSGILVLEFSVKDTGIGIARDKVGFLFEPFTQLDHFMTRKHGGTGLGLAISKRLVELMGGKIRLEESSERGTTFIFTVKAQLESDMVIKPHKRMRLKNQSTPRNSPLLSR
jgi:PAS domain S-box-containing protein